MKADIEQTLKTLPSSPGVYLMHGEDDEIIYIGKAVNLKNRVRQYFHGGDGRMMLSVMVPRINRIE